VQRRRAANRPFLFSITTPANDWPAAEFSNVANLLEAAMDGNRVEGGFRDVAGKVQDAVGGLTGDAATQVRGKINQASGQAQRAYGQAVDEARGFTAENPIAALVTTLGLGMILGMFFARR
jgi:uncharacterized protein YjbJ (UPF0337 family)